MTADNQALAQHNIVVLTAVQALGAANPPIIISLGGLVRRSFSSIRR